MKYLKNFKYLLFFYLISIYGMENIFLKKEDSPKKSTNNITEKEEEYKEKKEEIEIKTIREALYLFLEKKDKESDLKSKEIIEKFNFIGSPYYSISTKKRPYLVFRCSDNMIAFHLDSHSNDLIANSIERLPLKYLYRFGRYVQKKIQQKRLVYEKSIFKYEKGIFKSSINLKEDLTKIDYSCARIFDVDSISFRTNYEYIYNLLLKIKNFYFNYYRFSSMTSGGKLFFIQILGDPGYWRMNKTSEEQNLEGVKECFSSSSHGGEWTISIIFSRESNPEEEVRIDFCRFIDYKIKDVYWYEKSLQEEKKENAYEYIPKNKTGKINNLQIIEEINKYFHPIEFFFKDFERNAIFSNDYTLPHLFNYLNFKKKIKKEKLKISVLKKINKDLEGKYKNMFGESIQLACTGIPSGFKEYFENK